MELIINRIIITNYNWTVFSRTSNGIKFYIVELSAFSVFWWTKLRRDENFVCCNYWETTDVSNKSQLSTTFSYLRRTRQAEIFSIYGLWKLGPMYDCSIVCYSFGHIGQFQCSKKLMSQWCLIQLADFKL